MGSVVRSSECTDDGEFGVLRYIAERSTEDCESKAGTRAVWSASWWDVFELANLLSRGDWARHTIAIDRVIIVWEQFLFSEETDITTMYVHK